MNQGIYYVDRAEAEGKKETDRETGRWRKYEKRRKENHRPRTVTAAARRGGNGRGSLFSRMLPRAYIVLHSRATPYDGRHQARPASLGHVHYS